MVLIPSESDGGCCSSCERQKHIGLSPCGVCCSYRSNNFGHKRSVGNESVDEKSAIKIRRLEGSDFSSSSDDEFLDSTSTAESDDDSTFSTYSRSPVIDTCGRNSEIKLDGLSLLLEAMVRSESSFENRTLPFSVDSPVDDMIDNSTEQKKLGMSDGERWSMMFDALEEYGRINVHFNVPNSYECCIKGHSVKLGTWLSTQRQLKRKGCLRPERELLLQRLVDAGLLCWSMPSIASPDDEKWTIMYNALVDYGNIHNQCNVPYSYDATLEDGTVVKLGAWLRKQREQKKKGSLRPDREQRLQVLVSSNMLRMPSGQSADDDQWSAMMEALEEYGAKHGHCNVPQSHEFRTSDGTIVRLGSWLRKQRELKKKGAGRMEREATLQLLVDQNMLQWEAPCHSPSDDDKWDVMLGALIRYAEQHGHCNLSSSHEFTIYDGTVVKLGAWLSQQRHHHKKGKLRADREAKLQILVDEGKLNWGMRCEGQKIGLLSAVDSRVQSC